MHGSAAASQRSAPPADPKPYAALRLMMRERQTSGIDLPVKALAWQADVGRLVRAVAAGAVARGELPFLHVLASNDSALSLYRGLGFEARRTMAFGVFARGPLDS